MINEPNFVTEKIEENASYGKFSLSPLPSGFGTTLGHSLRRMLLSSLEGYAATYVRINDIVHPFSTISGIKETALDIILNIKLLRFKAIGSGPYELKLKSNGRGKVYAKDFKGGGDIEVVNKDQYIAEITDDKKRLDIDIIVERGVGYTASEEKEKKEFGLLALDSVFSPVVRVNYAVEGARVGRRTNFDKLIIEIWTDDSKTPSEALKAVALILSSYFNYILSGRDQKRKEDSQETNEDDMREKVDKKVYQTIIDELDLPTRVINALLREKIETVADLVKRKKENLVDLKGVGKKSLDLIEKELEKLGIPFE